MTADPLELIECQTCLAMRPCCEWVPVDIDDHIAMCHHCRDYNPLLGRRDPNADPCEACEEWNLEGAAVLMGPIEVTR